MEPGMQMHVRLGASDTHYPGDLIPASTLLRLMSDCGSALMLKEDGVSGLLAKWNGADFHAPVRVGEFVRIDCDYIRKGNRSRDIRCQVWRTIELIPGHDGPDNRRYLDTPELIAEGVFVGVLHTVSGSPGPSADTR